MGYPEGANGGVGATEEQPEKWSKWENYKASIISSFNPRSDNLDRLLDTLNGIPGEGVVLGGVSKLFAAEKVVQALSLAERAALAEKGFINPALVKFTQDSVRNTFSDGRTIDALITSLRGEGGAALAKTMEPIRLVLREGELYTLDNRRLVAFSAAGRDVPYRMATQAEIAWEWAKKFKTTIEQGMGQYITIRPGKQ